MVNEKESLIFYFCSFMSVNFRKRALKVKLKVKSRVKQLNFLEHSV